jgi:hypothetical protein
MSPLFVPRTSRTVAFSRLQVMGTPAATRCRSSSLTTAELGGVQRLWSIAGLPPVSGYGAAIFAVLLAATPALVEMVSSIDFDDAAAVADAVDALLEWLDHIQQDHCRRRTGQPTR